MKVAVAVIADSEDRILITRRGASSSHPGFWEFPGGKLEVDESPEHALVREVREEVGLSVLDFIHLCEIDHVYDNISVTLCCYKVTKYTGEASCCESQSDMRWVSVKQLKSFKFPEANKQIVDKLSF